MAEVRSEHALGDKWDRCITNTIVYAGTGFAVGAVLSLGLFRRKGWPVGLGSGFGLGMAFSEAQYEFSNAAPANKGKAAAE